MRQFSTSHLLTATLLLTGCVIDPSVLGTSAKKAPTDLAPQDVFAAASSSIVVVDSLDGNGKPLALGSGVVVEQDTVVTNYHVVSGASTIQLRQGQRKWPASVKFTDPSRDLSQIFAQSLGLPAVKQAPISTLKVGQKAYAIGNPQGLELTLSEGLISGLRETDDGSIVQTSAPVSPGSSGGGLFNSKAELIGIVTFGFQDSQNLNFALPSDWISQIPARSKVSDETISSTASVLPLTGYEEPLGLFVIGYPRDWLRSAGSGKQLVLFEAKLKLPAEAALGVIVANVTAGVPEDVALDAYMKGYSDEMIRQGEIIIAQGNATLSGRAAKTVDHTITVQSKVFKARQTVTIRGDKAYQLNFLVSPPDKFKEWEPTANRMATSFKIL